MEEKAQGALEYLLLIGGAVLVAAVVIAILTGVTSGAKNTVHEQQGAAGTELANLNTLR